MWWNNVETKPYGSYPQHWDVKTLKLLDEAHQAAGVTASWDKSQADDQAAPYGVYNGLALTEASGPNEQVLGYRGRAAGRAQRRLEADRDGLRLPEPG